ncbi:hypothetical protein K491DRAFT_711430 [Lophiostoma macrostomum CBS 122681]|uniref:Histone chaperone domain-containing protein n=1 Tax=Lophiostoma macrostomum CBS 122681 TaxID=1314788 RepID=A0A6A6TPL3_9PLEO|nr:hypothetical protein K491DRAFT_711430 [Lophiostoma macrostomum CBS 122681]
MADQGDHKMEGVEEPTTVDKGKGKAPQAAPVEESEDSSDESAAEDQGGDAEPEDVDEDNMEEIDTSNIVGSRTRGKNIDYAKAAQDLGEDDDEEDDDDFVDPDDNMQE